MRVRCYRASLAQKFTLQTFIERVINSVRRTSADVAIAHREEKSLQDASTSLLLLTKRTPSISRVRKPRKSFVLAINFRILHNSPGAIDPNVCEKGECILFAVFSDSGGRKSWKNDRSEELAGHLRTRF